jgi:hypothetical protein
MTYPTPSGRIGSRDSPSLVENSPDHLLKLRQSITLQKGQTEYRRVRDTMFHNLSARNSGTAVSF